MGIRERAGRWLLKGITDSGDLLQMFVGQPTSSGKVVNAMSALGCLDVLGCIRVICEGIAQVPARLLKPGPDGRGSVTLEDHPTHKLISRRPNPLQNPFEFREMMTAQAALSGDGLGMITRDAQGRALEILPLMRSWVEIDVTREWQHRYKVTFPSGGSQFYWPASDMFHLRGPSWEPHVGLDIVKLIREAVGTSLSVEEHQGKLHANGVRVSGILTTTSELSDSARARLREEWASHYSGSANAFKVAVLEGGMDWKQTALTSDDAQSLETLREQGVRIARAFRVFPSLIGYSDKASTYASAEQFFIAHVVHTLTPWARRWEEAFKFRVLDNDDESYLRLFFQGLMRGDAKTRAEFYSRGIQMGWMTRNEVRALEDLEPLDGLDEPLMPLNMTEIGAEDDAADASDGNGSDAPPAPAPADPDDEGNEE